GFRAGLWSRMVDPRRRPTLLGRDRSRVGGLGLSADGQRCVAHFSMLHSARLRSVWAGILVVARFLRDRWFAVDPRSMGLFRIFFGLVILFDLLRRVPVMVAFYTNDGVLTNHFSLFRPNGRFSIYHMFSTPQEVAVAFLLTALVYVMYILGWHTKLFQILAFICVTSLHSRNVMLENGGDVVMNIV